MHRHAATDCPPFLTRETIETKQYLLPLQGNFSPEGAACSLRKEFPLLESKFFPLRAATCKREAKNLCITVISLDRDCSLIQIGVISLLGANPYILTLPKLSAWMNRKSVVVDVSTPRDLVKVIQFSVNLP